jgi:hypothetical protein
VPLAQLQTPTFLVWVNGADSTPPGGPYPPCAPKCP